MNDSMRQNMERRIPLRFRLENAGPIKEGEVEIGDITVIAGGNNSGKSHIAYATWFAQAALLDHRISGEPFEWGDTPEEAVGKILHDNIDALDIKTDTPIVGDLAPLFGSFAYLYPDSSISMDTPEGLGTRIKDEIRAISQDVRGDYNHKKSSLDWMTFLSHYFNRFNPDSKALLIEYQKNRAKDSINQEFVEDLLMRCYKKCVFPDRHYLLTSERSAAIAYNRYINGYSRMPQANLKLTEPVRYNIQWFVSEMYGYQGAEVNPWFEKTGADEIFTSIIGGKLQLVDGVIKFVPTEWVGESETPLPFEVLSASQRNIATVYFCLKYMVGENDFLIIDEPESYLHPENQRRLTQILAIAANIGIRIMITTHSDYILNELSLLIMMGFRKTEKHIDALMKKEDYSSCALDINEKTIRIYEMKNEHGDLEPKKRDITPERGILIESIDEQVRKMNRLEDEIVFGGDYD